MKQCSKCNQFYNDNTLNFCLNDGTTLSLVSEAPTQVLTDEATVIRNPKEPYLIEPPKRFEFISLYLLLQSAIMLITALILLGTKIVYFLPNTNRVDEFDGMTVSQVQDFMSRLYLAIFLMHLLPVIINWGQIIWIRRKNRIRHAWLLILANLIGFVFMWILVVFVNITVNSGRALFQNQFMIVLAFLCAGIAFGAAQSVCLCFMKRKVENEFL